MSETNADPHDRQRSLAAVHMALANARREAAFLLAHRMITPEQAQAMVANLEQQAAAMETHHMLNPRQPGVAPTGWGGPG